MALLTKKGSYLPEGAIRVSREEALKIQLDLIRNWPSRLEVSYLRYGSYLSAVGGAISSSVIFLHLKKYLKFGKRDLAIKIFPTIIFSSYLSYRSTQKFCTEPIALMTQRCPICLQVKFALAQCYVNIVLPSLLGVLLMSPIILSKKPPNMPTDNEGLFFWKKSGKILKAGTKKFQYLFAAQSILVLFLPYLQEKQLHDIMSKIREQK